MNKAQLIEALSSHYEGNKAEANRALTAVLDTITEQVAKGEKVALTGFGAFEKVHRASRMVRNPRTGERKKAKATNVPRFRAGSELKAYVAGDKKFTPTKPAAKSTAAKATTAKTTAAKPATKSTAAKTTTAKKTTATKSTAAKTTAKAPAKKTTAAKSTAARKTTAAKKTTATKSTAKKTTAAKSTTKAPAKKAAK